MFTEKYISNLSTNFSGRTQANGKINFGMCITKVMKLLLHWVQDSYCISGDPTIVEMSKVMFIKQLDTTLYRSDIRRNIIDQCNRKAKEASPGPLKSEKNWK